MGSKGGEVKSLSKAIVRASGEIGEIGELGSGSLHGGVDENILGLGSVGAVGIDDRMISKGGTGCY